MDWVAFGEIFDKYGSPLIILGVLIVFFYKKVWPLFENFILGILGQQKDIAVALQKATDALEKISDRQEHSIRANAELAQHLLDEIQKGKK